MKTLLGKFVVVTTGNKNRGVFGGTLVGGDMEPGILELKNARNCLFWSKETKGVFGLTQKGPQNGSRVGPCIPRLFLSCVNSIGEATPEAITQWEAEPWD